MLWCSFWCHTKRRAHKKHISPARSSRPAHSQWLRSCCSYSSRRWLEPEQIAEPKRYSCQSANMDSIRPWKKLHPMGKGCQLGFALNPKLRAQVHTFLMRHSKKTSRFCRTKQRDQKVHSHRVETLFRTTKC